MSKSPLAGRPPFEIDDANVIYSTPAQPAQPITSRGRYEIPPQERPDSTYRPYSPPSANHKDEPAAPPYSLTVPPSHQRTQSADSAADAIGGGFLNERESFYSTATDDDYGAPKQPPQTQTQPRLEPDNSSTKSARARPVLEKIRTDVEEMRPRAQVSRPDDHYGRSPDSHRPHDDRGLPVNHRPRGSPSPPAAPLNIPIQSHAAPQPQRPQPAFMAPPNQGGGYGQVNMSPNPTPALYSPGGISPGGMSPAIIPPSSTPIQAAFAKPIKPAFIKFEESSDGHDGSVMSHESHIPIMRGNKEETLLTRSANGGRIPRVGAKRDGDDFWRRFSMVAKREQTAPVKEKKSQWLQSALRGRSSYKRWVWFAFFIFICLLGGGAFAIYWFTRNNQAHSVPVAIGGSAENTLSAEAAGATAAAGTTNARPLLTATEKEKRWAAPTPTPAFTNRSIVDSIGHPVERRGFQSSEEFSELHQRSNQPRHHRRARAQRL